MSITQRAKQKIFVKEFLTRFLSDNKYILDIIRSQYKIKTDIIPSQLILGTSDYIFSIVETQKVHKFDFFGNKISIEDSWAINEERIKDILAIRRCFFKHVILNMNRIESVNKSQLLNYLECIIKFDENVVFYIKKMSEFRKQINLYDEIIVQYSKDGIVQLCKIVSEKKGKILSIKKNRLNVSALKLKNNKFDHPFTYNDYFAFPQYHSYGPIVYIGREKY